MLHLAYLVSHPIQYQAPLLRRIAREPGIDLTVLFGSDFSVRGYKDEGFGVEVAWDTPLLEGYKSEFLKSWRDTGTVSFSSPISRGIYRPPLASCARTHSGFTATQASTRFRASSPPTRSAFPFCCVRRAGSATAPARRSSSPQSPFCCAPSAAPSTPSCPSAP
jgi:hypothetical protein